MSHLRSVARKGFVRQSRALAGVLVAAAISLLAPLEQSVRAQAATRCTCADVYDLINRLNMAQAARSALLEQLSKFEASDIAGGKRSHMDDRNDGVSNQDALRSAILKGMAQVQMPGASISAAETKGDCGAAIVSHGSTCIEEIVMWHEEHVHVPACNDGPKTALGFRAPQTTVDYIREEIAGYESEIQHIKEVLRMLPPTCRPSGWIGSIRFHEEQRAERNNTLEPTSSRVSGTERESQAMTRDTKVWYRDPATTLTAATLSPHASAEVSETVTMFSTSTLRRGCVGGLATPRYDGTITTSGEEDITSKGSGEKDIDVSFEYDPRSGKYTLGFEIPDADATGSIVQKATVSGSCKASDDGTKTSPSVPTSRTYDGQRITVSGTVLPRSTADMLQGRDKVDLAPPLSLPDFVSTHSGTVYWTFFKVP